MISDFVYDLCHERETVSSRLANDPDDAPGVIAKELFGKKQLPDSDTTEQKGYNLDRAFECGKWGTSRPSDLFLKVRSSSIMSPTTVHTHIIHRSTMMF